MSVECGCDHHGDHLACSFVTGCPCVKPTMTTPDGLTPATLVTDMARHLSEHARHEVGGIPCIVTSEWELEAVERQAGQRALDTVADRIASGAWDEDLFRPVIEKGLARAREQAVARHVRETGCEALEEALRRHIVALAELCELVTRHEDATECGCGDFDDWFQSWDGPAQRLHVPDDVMAEAVAALASPATEEVE